MQSGRSLNGHFVLVQPGMEAALCSLSFVFMSGRLPSGCPLHPTQLYLYDPPSDTGELSGYLTIAGIFYDFELNSQNCEITLCRQLIGR
jgi:hypothetical protein